MSYFSRFIQDCSFGFLQFYLQDTKSSNGTFINSQRLSRGSEESPPCEIMSGDVIQFGVDVTENTRKGKGVDRSLVSFQVYLFRTSYCNPVFKTKWHSRCKKTVLFVLFIPLLSFVLAVSPVPMWYLDQETFLLKTQTLISTSTPLDGLYWVVPMACFLPWLCRCYCVQGRWRSGKGGSAWGHMFIYCLP